VPKNTFGVKKGEECGKFTVLRSEKLCFLQDTQYYLDSGIREIKVGWA